MRSLLLIIIFNLNASCFLWGQGQGNLWFCYTNSVVDFSGTVPVLATPPLSQPNVHPNAFPGYFPETEGAQMAICDAAGNLVFFVKVQNVPNNGILGPLYPAMPKIFDRTGYSMPNVAINANWETKSEFPIIIPHPGDTNLYYVFYPRNGGLQYSIVDMALNNGLGDVITGQKDILLSGWGTLNGTKLNAVQGCDCIWLVARSRTSNQYYSYRIDGKGLNRSPVISDCGLLPLRDYNDYGISDGINWRVSAAGGGRMSFNKEGTTLAVATRQGIELCDFEKCSGIVKNPRLIDTLPFLGLCFSPNSSRLYASQLYPLPYYGQQGQVYQFDLNQSTPAAITSSKTLVVSNQVMACWNPILGCYCDTMSSHIADLRMGPDNKVYMSNTKRYCEANVPVYPPTPTNPDHTLHVIHNPDALGLACNPEMDYLKLNTPIGYAYSGSYDKSLMYLPNTVVIPPPSPDTATGVTLPVTVCFADSVGLTAPQGTSCRIWDNGSTEPVRSVDKPGTYWVNYYKNCTSFTDTFYVSFIPVPKMPQLHYGCPREGMINIEQPDSNNTRYEYILSNNSGTVSSGSSATGYRFNGLSSGTYTLQIKTGACDTSLILTVEEYPQPEIVTMPRDTLIKYGDTIQLQATGASLYAWWPTGPLNTATNANPLARPLQSTLFEVIGINEYGCRDTGYVQVNIDYSMTDLVPNAFSPNGDGLNDVFKIEGIQYQKIGMFKVFNRFGQEIFYTTNPDHGWDGTFKGRACDAGTYYYLVQLLYPDGSVKNLKGDIILIR